MRGSGLYYRPDSPSELPLYRHRQSLKRPRASEVAERPKKKKLDPYREAVEALHAERKRRVAMKKKIHGVFKDPKSVTGATWHPGSIRRRAYYHTTINDGTNYINIRSYSDVEKDETLRLYWAFQNANPNSLTNKKKRKAEREAANAEKRAGDVETYGDNCALERELLTQTRDAVTGGVLSFLVLMLQTKADALFRTIDMPKDKYMREQHKTCSKIYESKRGQRSYFFNDVMGYAGCLVVFECKEDGAIFVAYGDDIDKAYTTHIYDHLTITIGKYTDEPVLKNKPWLTYLGKGLGVHAKLTQRLVDECGKDKLPLCSIAEANSELNKNHATEEVGIQLLIQTEFGGIVPKDDPRWLELKQEWQDKKHIYLLTENGDVVAYPEHAQNGKTDLLVFRKMLDYENPEKWQCKSARPKSDVNGLQVNMTTANGRGQRKSNTSKAGDNDFYVVTRVSKDKFHYWKFTDAEMVKHGYVGTGLAGFVVYTKDAPAESERGNAWTVEKHRSSVV